MTTLVWSLEWRRAAARRRLFVLNVTMPLVLVAPMAVGAPHVHAAAAYAVLFGIFSVFGSAIPLVRDGEGGLVERMLRGGVSPRALLLQRTAAGTVLDALQLAPALLVVGAGAGASSTSLGVAALALVGSLWVGNLLGVVAASAARSHAEAALFSAVFALLLLHASGVFRTPAPGGPAALVESLSPFRALHESLLNLTFGRASGFTSLAVWAGLGAAVVTAAAPRIVASLPGAARPSGTC